MTNVATPAALWPFTLASCIRAEVTPDFLDHIVDVGIGEHIARRLQPHHRIAGAQAQTRARGDFEPALGERVRKGVGQRCLRLRQQPTPPTLGVAIGTNADKKANRRGHLIANDS